ncbi:hypothetical protein CDD81_2007 [Ophiocordyceps australis]|uniref:Uncharacterized protein n=1 Tax=Ophiocordyceps australis TaxID=1399860 RepID=A0A2C5YE55_9HYPO|nr:hypothetical protein CDD81_2007 [Ophiocordyceps australis]
MMLPSLLSTVLAASVIVPAGAVPCRHKPHGVPTSRISPQGPPALATPASPQGPARQKGQNEEPPKSVVLEISTTMSSVVEQPTQKTKCGQTGDENKADAEENKETETQKAEDSGDKEQPTSSSTGPLPKSSEDKEVANNAGTPDKPASSTDNEPQNGTGKPYTPCVDRQSPNPVNDVPKEPSTPIAPQPPVNAPVDEPTQTKPDPAPPAPVSDKTIDNKEPNTPTKPFTPPKPVKPQGSAASAKPKLPTEAPQPVQTSIPETTKPEPEAEQPKKPDTSKQTPPSTQDGTPKKSPPSKSSGLSGTASMTPHDKYSSSIGVLGCKMNIDRVAYWPGAVNCNDICVEVSHKGRSLKLLKIDSSTGAHDMSYDAWNYLAFGKGAKEEPHAGGGIDMDYKFVPAEECADLLDNQRMALSAANSMNYYASCKEEKSSWVANNMDLWNFQDARCTFGANEQCEVDLDKGENIPRCASGIGSNQVSGMEVADIPYMG